MIKKTKRNLTDERSYFRPFNYPWAYDAWLKHEQSHWMHTEVPMLEDVKDWKNKLSKEQKHFLTQIFRFLDRKSTRLNSSHVRTSRMPSSA